MAPDSLSDHPMAGGEERDLVFLSYSQTDAVWAQRFQVMLAAAATSPVGGLGNH